MVLQQNTSRCGHGCGVAPRRLRPHKDEAEAQGGTPNGEEPYQMDPI
jgi:hypothetical protein